jgi:hypothetical protein
MIKTNFIILLILVLSCNKSNHSNVQHQREWVPNPEKFEHDGYSSLADSLKPKFSPDVSINKIHLADTTGIIALLGKNPMDRLTETGEDNEFPHISVFSKDRKQRFRLIFHPGGSSNEFYEFEVSYDFSNCRECIVADENEFMTESEVKLGITVGELKSLKGDPYHLLTGSLDVLQYELNDFENSHFLQKYGYPKYYADYYFDNGYLVKFKFGFEYP